MAGSKGTPYNTTRETQNATSAPIGVQAPFYQQLWDAASGALAGGPSPFQTQAAGTLAGTAGSLGMGADPLRAQALSTIGGQYLGAGPQTAWRPDTTSFQTIGNTPGIDAVTAAALRAPTEQLTEVALPAIRSAAISQGAYGGARQDLQENQAVREWGRTAGDIAANLRFTDYNNAINRALQAWTTSQGLGANIALGNLSAANSGWNAERDRMLSGASGALGAANQLAMSPAQALAAAGQMDSPWYGLGEMAQILGAGNFGSRTGSGTSTAPNANYETAGAQTLKLLAGLGGLGGSLFAAPAGGTSAVSGIQNFLKSLSA